VIATQNLARIIAQTRAAPRVLDVGGGAAPLNTATHVIDCSPFDPAAASLHPEEPTRFDASTWAVADVCDGPWPYPDGFFDFAFCSHLLEDVRDPIFVCRELARVARAGYVETPSRLREIVHKKEGYFWRRLVGRPVRIGFGHHRWFVEAEDDGLVFTAKTLTSAQHRDFFITRAELGRWLAPEDRAVTLFWEGGLPARERLLIAPGETEADLRAFKRQALARLRQRHLGARRDNDFVEIAATGV
jgi:SAM-dependent methyltransferase